MAEEEKIGFNNPGKDNPEPTEKGKKVKFSKQHRTGLQKWSFAMFLLGMIFSIFAIFYFFLPIFSALVGFVVFIIYAVVVAVPVMVTFFTILLSEDYRAWCGDLWEIPNWFFDFANHSAALSFYYIIPGAAALFFDFLGIILCSVSVGKYKSRYVTYLVFCIVNFVIVGALTIIYFASGLNIYNV